MNRTLRRAAWAGLLVAAFAGSPGAHAKEAPPPEIDPKDFVRRVENPFFPLEPDTTLLYEGKAKPADGKSATVPTRHVVFVSRDTKTILGVVCTVVRTRAFVNDVYVRSVEDWYAQDAPGNVWHFGAAVRELDSKGDVRSTRGSWEAGVDGARPGKVMLAKPKVGDVYEQEDAPRIEQDSAEVTSLEGTACVLYACLKDLLVTKEWSRLAPATVAEKYYGKGVGLVRTATVGSEDDFSDLVGVLSGPSPF